MAVISGGKIIGGSVGPLMNAGAPSAGTNEVITATVTGAPTGGSTKWAKDGLRTAAIPYDADGAAVQTILEAVPTVGSGGVTVAGVAGGPYTITAAGNNARKSLGNWSLAENNLTGGTTPTVGFVETTPGVDATARGAAAGALLLDTTNKKLYINTGTPTAPTWTVVGTQS